MKKLFAVLLVSILAANTFVVSALAESCADMHETETASAVMLMTDSDEPCHHEAVADEDHRGHCEGPCFCLHGSVQQTPFLLGLFSDSIVATTEIPNSWVSEDLDSIAVLPPQRPPKFFS